MSEAPRLAAAALAVNNHRDIAHDRLVGRRTFAGTFGEPGSLALFNSLLFAPFVLLLPLALVAARALLAPWPGLARLGAVLVAVAAVATLCGRWLQRRLGGYTGDGLGATEQLAEIAVLLAFTFFMGLMLSRLLSMVLGFKNGPSLVMTAFGGTAVVFFAMASLASVIKRDLSNMGKFLFVGALILLAVGIVNIFMQSTALMMTLSVLAIGIFSAFMLYDLKRIIDGGETNYISATLAIYLDIYNVFQSLLAILGIAGGERD